VNLIRAQLIPYFLLMCLVAAVSYAQAPASPSPATSSGSSASAPAKKASAGSERVILKVGNMQVTQGEFESRISDIEPQGGDDDEKGITDKDRRRLGDDYASVLMLSQQAVANHLESSPEVSRQLAVARIQVLSDAEFANLMRQAQPTFEEVSQYYSAHLSNYDQVHIRRLFIWKQRDNDKGAPVLSSAAARERADRLRQAYAAGTSEPKLADDLRKSGDGMLDVKPVTFPRGELSRHMEKVAFGLKEGEWSEVEDTPASLLLIQLVKRGRQQLGEVSSIIEKELQGQKMQALLDDLKKKSGIWMDDQYFGTAVAPVPDAQRRASNPPSELQKSAKKGGNNNEEQQK
jgi:PPIC-type PPIASE domain